MKLKITVALCALFFAGIATAQTEFLNLDFGNNGSVCINTPESLSPLVMGDLIKIGDSYYGITGFGGYYLVKLSATGNLDEAFGTNGYVPLNLDNAGGSLYDFSNTFIKLMPDNNLLLVVNPSGIAGHKFMMKTDLNGNIITGFGNNGYVGLTWPDIINLHTVTIVGNEIIMTGTNDSSVGDIPYRYIAATKYDLDGNPVTSFGDNGIMLFYLDDVYAFPKSGYYSPATGKVTVNVDGYADTDFQIPYSAIMRFDIVNGVADSSFGTNGIVYVHAPGTTDTYSMINALTVDTNGDIYVAGNLTDELPEQHAFLKKYNDAGVADTSFGNAGTLLFEINGADYQTVCAINKTTNRITISGSSSFENANYEKLFLMRTLNNGTIDTDFGNEGVVLDETPSAVVYTASYKTIIENENLITVATLSNACTSSQPKPSVVQFITGVLGTAAPAEKKPLLYPNPVNDYLYINGSADIIKAELFEVSGKLLTVPVDINARKADLSTLQSGIYILKLQTGEGTATIKVIKG